MDIHDIYNIFTIICWTVLIVACWMSQLFSTLKSVFSYGKLCSEPTKDCKQTQQNELFRLVTHPRLYMSHAEGFSWYYRISCWVCMAFTIELVLSLCLDQSYLQSLFLHANWYKDISILYRVLSLVCFPAHAMFSMYHISLGQYGVSTSSYTLLQLLPFTLLCIHLIRRRQESQLVLQLESRPKARQHVLVMLCGLAYYILLILTVVMVSPIPAVGLSPSPSLSTLETCGGVLTLLLIASVTVFIAASYQQARTHAYLRHLKHTAVTRGTRYLVPSHGWFRFVTCPHYLAECLIYAALAAATTLTTVLKQGQYGVGNKDLSFWSILLQVLPMWLCLVWVVSNLWISAKGTLRWYKGEFASHQLPQNALWPCGKDVIAVCSDWKWPVDQKSE